MSVGTTVDRIAALGQDHGVTLTRTSPRGPGRLALRFVDPGGHLVAGQWYRNQARAAEVAAETCSRDEHAVVVGDSGVVLQPHGLDRRLPALADLVATPGTWLVQHRAEQHAVVRAASGRYVKVVPPAATATIAAAYRTTRPSRSVRLPKLGPVDPIQGTVSLAPLPGRTLWDRLTDTTVPDGALTTDGQRVGQALRAFHAGRTRYVQAPHDVEAEVVSTLRWLRAATEHGRLEQHRWGRAIASIDDLVRGAEAGMVRVHRDLHDQHVLLEAGQPVGLIGLDHATRGEAAVDLANLLVHLELRVLEGVVDAARVQACSAGLLLGYGRAPHVARRCPAYLAMARLRIAAAYAFRPGSEHVVDQLLDGAFEGLPEM